MFQCNRVGVEKAKKNMASFTALVWSVQILLHIDLELNCFHFFFLHTVYRYLKIKLTNAFSYGLQISRPAGLAGSPVISDISLIRLSPHAAATGESPFSPTHHYVNPHMEQYLRSVHSSPTLSVISAARGLSPADGESALKGTLHNNKELIHIKIKSIRVYECHILNTFCLFRSQSCDDMLVVSEFIV